MGNALFRIFLIDRIKVLGLIELFKGIFDSRSSFKQETPRYLAVRSHSFNLEQKFILFFKSFEDLMHSGNRFNFHFDDLWVRVGLTPIFFDFSAASRTLVTAADSRSSSTISSSGEACPSKDWSMVITLSARNGRDQVKTSIWSGRKYGWSDWSYCLMLIFSSFKISTAALLE